MQRKAFDANEALCHSHPLKQLVSLYPPIQPDVELACQMVMLKVIFSNGHGKVSFFHTFIYLFVCLCVYLFSQFLELDFTCDYLL